MNPETELKKALLLNYRSGPGMTSSARLYINPEEAWPYFRANYEPLIESTPRSARILEVGCGPGALLAWLRSRGFENLQGIDASPGDVEFANRALGRALVVQGDARAFLESRPGEFDLVIMKAFLEHVGKHDLLETVNATARCLSPKGRAVIDVPNMDWILAAHERYMDLTHEVGFTRESLLNLLQLAFSQVAVKGSVLGFHTRAQRLWRRALIGCLRKAFYVLGEGASEVLFECRSIIAVASLPRGPGFCLDETAGS